MSRTLTVVQGEKRTFTFTTIDQVTKTPINLTGAFVYFAVKRLDSDAVQILQKDNDPAQQNTGISLVDPVNGIWSATVERVDTLTEATGDLLYDAWVRLDPAGDNEPESVARGLLKLLAIRVVF